MPNTGDAFPAAVDGAAGVAAQNACVGSASEIVTRGKNADRMTFLGNQTGGSFACPAKWTSIAARVRSSRIGTSSAVRSIVAIGVSM